MDPWFLMVWPVGVSMTVNQFFCPNRSTWISDRRTYMAKVGFLWRVMVDFRNVSLKVRLSYRRPPGPSMVMGKRLSHILVGFSDRSWVSNTRETSVESITSVNSIPTTCKFPQNGLDLRTTPFNNVRSSNQNPQMTSVQSTGQDVIRLTPLSEKSLVAP